MSVTISEEIKNQIRRGASEIFGEVVETRRAIHRWPEVGFDLPKTAALVEEKLRRYGLEKIGRLCQTGVVAEIGEGDRCIALRADMDALELTEESNLPFASERPGYMHACGHDAHTAILTGAAKILVSLEKAGKLNGRVRLIFQPNEETSPGGALPMIAEGVLEGVDAIVGLHNYVWYRTGQIALREGILMANADDFDILLRGKSVHGSTPHQGKDAVVAASYLVTELQSIVSRRFSAHDAVVVTIGRLCGGTRRNIIAGSAELNGTARTLTDENRMKIKAEIQRVIEHVCAAHGVEAEFNWRDGYPAMTNDPGLTRLVAAAAEDLLGKENVIPIDKPTMGGEDFSFFARKIPGCMMRLGSWDGNPDNQSQHHSTTFDFDEKALETGMIMMAGSAVAFLAQKEDCR